MGSASGKQAKAKHSDGERSSPAKERNSLERRQNDQEKNEDKQSPRRNEHFVDGSAARKVELPNEAKSIPGTSVGQSTENKITPLRSPDLQYQDNSSEHEPTPRLLPSQSSESKFTQTYTQDEFEPKVVHGKEVKERAHPSNLQLARINGDDPRPVSCPPRIQQRRLRSRGEAWQTVDNKESLFHFSFRPTTPRDSHPDIEVKFQVVSLTVSSVAHKYLKVSANAKLSDVRHGISGHFDSFENGFIFLSSKNKAIALQEERKRTVFDILPKAPLGEPGPCFRYPSVPYKEVPFSYDGKRYKVVCACVIFLYHQCPTGIWEQTKLKQELSCDGIPALSFIPTSMTSWTTEHTGLLVATLYRYAATGRHRELEDILDQMKCDVISGCMYDHRLANPLHYACDNGHLEVCKILLSQLGKQLLYQVDINGKTPFHCALYRRRYDVVTYLLLHKPDFNKEDLHGNSCLDLLLAYDRKATYKVLEKCEQEFFPNSLRLYFLSFCLRNKDVANSKLFSQNLDCVNVKLEFGQTPVHLAVILGDKCVLDNLLNCGFKNDDPDSSGHLPFHYACKLGHTELLKQVMSDRVNVQDANEGIRLSVSRNHSDVAKCVYDMRPGLLIERETVALILYSLDANFDKHWNNLLPYLSCDKSLLGRYLLHASSIGNVNAAHLAIALGADVNYQDIMGRSPLHEAVQGKYDLMVRSLLNSNADPNILDWRGSTPLHYGSSEGNLAAVQILCELKETKYDLRDTVGRTPLLLAALNKKCDVVEYLLHNYNKQIGSEYCDIYGQNILHYCVNLTRKSTIDLILDKTRTIINESKAECYARDNAITQAYQTDARAWLMPDPCIYYSFGHSAKKPFNYIRKIQYWDSADTLPKRRRIRYFQKCVTVCNTCNRICHEKSHRCQKGDSKFKKENMLPFQFHVCEANASMFLNSNSPLHLAVASGSSFLVNKLGTLQRNLFVSRDQQNRHVYELAVDLLAVEELSALFEVKIADRRWPLVARAVASSTMDKDSDNRQCETVKFLLERGFSAEERCTVGMGYSGLTPLEIAAKLNKVELVGVLLYYGVNIAGFALHFAVFNGHQQIIRNLLDSVRKSDSDGKGRENSLAELEQYYSRDTSLLTLSCISKCVSMDIIKSLVELFPAIMRSDKPLVKGLDGLVFKHAKCIDPLCSLLSSVHNILCSEGSSSIVDKVACYLLESGLYVGHIDADEQGSYHVVCKAFFQAVQQKRWRVVECLLDRSMDEFWKCAFSKQDCDAPCQAESYILPISLGFAATEGTIVQSVPEFPNYINSLNRISAVIHLMLKGNVEENILRRFIQRGNQEIINWEKKYPKILANTSFLLLPVASRAIRNKTRAFIKEYLIPKKREDLKAKKRRKDLMAKKGKYLMPKKRKDLITKKKEDSIANKENLKAEKKDLLTKKLKELLTIKRENLMAKKIKDLMTKILMLIMLEFSYHCHCGRILKLLGIAPTLFMHVDLIESRMEEITDTTKITIYEKFMQFCLAEKLFKRDPTLLHAACFYGDGEILKTVLSSVLLLDVNERNSSGLTAVEIGAAMGYCTVVKELASKAAFINNDTLIACCVGQNFGGISKWRKFSQLKTGLSSQDEQSDRLNILKLILQVGNNISVNFVHPEYGLPFLCTIISENWSLMEHLLNVGVDVKVLFDQQNSNARRVFFERSTDILCMKVISLVLGFLPNLSTESIGEACLVACRRKSDVVLTRLLGLIDKERPEDIREIIEQTDEMENGLTLLHRLAKCSWFQCLKTVVGNLQKVHKDDFQHRAGFLNKMDWCGKTPLWYALTEQNWTVAVYLLTNGAWIGRIVPEGFEGRIGRRHFSHHNTSTEMILCLRDDREQKIAHSEYTSNFEKSVPVSNSKPTPTQMQEEKGTSSLSTRSGVEQLYKMAQTAQRTDCTIVHVACANGNQDILNVCLKNNPLSMQLLDVHGLFPIYYAYANETTHIIPASVANIQDSKTASTHLKYLVTCQMISLDVIQRAKSILWNIRGEPEDTVYSGSEEERNFTSVEYLLQVLGDMEIISLTSENTGSASKNATTIYDRKYTLVNELLQKINFSELDLHYLFCVTVIGDPLLLNELVEVSFRNKSLQEVLKLDILPGYTFIDIFLSSVLMCTDKKHVKQATAKDAVLPIERFFANESFRLNPLVIENATQQCLWSILSIDSVKQSVPANVRLNSLWMDVFFAEVRKGGIEFLEIAVGVIDLKSCSEKVRRMFNAAALLAAASGQTKVFEFLVRKQFSPSVKLDTDLMETLLSDKFVPSKWSTLFYAANSNVYSCFKSVLKSFQSKNIRVSSDDVLELVHVTAKCGNKDMFDILFKEFNATRKLLGMVKSALLVGAKNGREKYCIHVLNTVKLRDFSQTQEGPNILHYCGQYGMKDLATTILKIKSGTNLLSMEDNFNHTPADYAYYNGNIECLMLFLKYGAQFQDADSDVFISSDEVRSTGSDEEKRSIWSNEEDDDQEKFFTYGWFHFLMEENEKRTINTDVGIRPQLPNTRNMHIQNLLESKDGIAAKTFLFVSKFQLPRYVNEFYRLLYLSSRNGCVYSLRLLLEESSKLPYQDTKLSKRIVEPSGSLIAAIINKHTDCVKELLSYVEKNDFLSEDTFGYILHHAVIHCSREIISMILGKVGVQKEHISSAYKGIMPHTVAAGLGRQNILNMLCEFEQMPQEQHIFHWETEWDCTECLLDARIGWTKMRLEQGWRTKEAEVTEIREHDLPVTSCSIEKAIASGDTDYAIDCIRELSNQLTEETLTEFCELAAYRGNTKLLKYLKSTWISGFVTSTGESLSEIAYGFGNLSTGHYIDKEMASNGIPPHPKVLYDISVPPAVLWSSGLSVPGDHFWLDSISQRGMSFADVWITTQLNEDIRRFVEERATEKNIIPARICGKRLLVDIDSFRKQSFLPRSEVWIRSLISSTVVYGNIRSILESSNQLQSSPAVKVKCLKESNVGSVKTSVDYDGTISVSVVMKVHDGCNTVFLDETYLHLKTESLLKAQIDDECIPDKEKMLRALLGRDVKISINWNSIERCSREDYQKILRHLSGEESPSNSLSGLEGAIAFCQDRVRSIKQCYDENTAEHALSCFSSLKEIVIRYVTAVPAHADSLANVQDEVSINWFFTLDKGHIKFDSSLFLLRKAIELFHSVSIMLLPAIRHLSAVQKCKKCCDPNVYLPHYDSFKPEMVKDRKASTRRVRHRNLKDKACKFIKVATLHIDWLSFVTEIPSLSNLRNVFFNEIVPEIDLLAHHYIACLRFSIQIGKIVIGVTSETKRRPISFSENVFTFRLSFKHTDDGLQLEPLNSATILQEMERRSLSQTCPKSVLKDSRLAVQKIAEHAKHTNGMDATLYLDEQKILGYFLQMYNRELTSPVCLVQTMTHKAVERLKCYFIDSFCNALYSIFSFCRFLAKVNLPSGLWCAADAKTLQRIGAAGWRGQVLVLRKNTIASKNTVFKYKLLKKTELKEIVVKNVAGVWVYESFEKLNQKLTLLNSDHVQLLSVGDVLFKVLDAKALFEFVQAFPSRKVLGCDLAANAFKLGHEGFDPAPWDRRNVNKELNLLVSIIDTKLITKCYSSVNSLNIAINWHSFISRSDMDKATSIDIPIYNFMATMEKLDRKWCLQTNKTTCFAKKTVAVAVRRKLEHLLNVFVGGLSNDYIKELAPLRSVFGISRKLITGITVKECDIHLLSEVDMCVNVENFSEYFTSLDPLEETLVHLLEIELENLFFSKTRATLRKPVTTDKNVGAVMETNDTTESVTSSRSKHAILQSRPIRLDLRTATVGFNVLYKIIKSLAEQKLLLNKEVKKVLLAESMTNESSIDLNRAVLTVHISPADISVVSLGMSMRNALSLQSRRMPMSNKNLRILLEDSQFYFPVKGENKFTCALQDLQGYKYQAGDLERALTEDAFILKTSANGKVFETQNVPKTYILDFEGNLCINWTMNNSYFGLKMQLHLFGKCIGHFYSLNEDQLWQTNTQWNEEEKKLKIAKGGKFFFYLVHDDSCMITSRLKDGIKETVLTAGRNYQLVAVKAVDAQSKDKVIFRILQDLPHVPGVKQKSPYAIQQEEDCFCNYVGGVKQRFPLFSYTCLNSDRLVRLQAVCSECQLILRIITPFCILPPDVELNICPTNKL